MRYLFITAIIMLFAISSFAQSTWNVSTAVGLSHTPSGRSSSAGFSLYIPELNYDIAPGILFDVKVWKVYKNKWQVGLSFETGTLMTPHKITTEIYRNSELQETRSGWETEHVVSPNAVPALFVHYQVNLSEKAYVHGGIMGGIITGGNGEILSKNITVPIGGLDLSIAIDLNKNVKLQLENGWRITRINRGVDLSRTVEGSGPGSYSIITAKNFTVKYLVHALGLVVKI